MNARRNPSVLIIGAGATGMLSAIRLRDAGITNITIIEKADRVGGLGARTPIRVWPAISPLTTTAIPSSPPRGAINARWGRSCKTTLSMSGRNTA